MTCDEARLALGADPSASTPALEEHVRGCAACARLRREMQALDADILRALQQPPDIAPARSVPHAHRLAAVGAGGQRSSGDVRRVFAVAPATERHPGA